MLDWVSIIVVFSFYEGLVFGLVGIGIYLTLRVLAFPDLTLEGSFPLGASVAAVLIVAGVNPYLATLAATGAGLCAGLVTALLNTKLRLPALLCGIMLMVGLYSINLRIIGGANISLIRETTIFDKASKLLGLPSGSIVVSITVTLALAAAVFFILNWFLHTEIGLSLRATGDNEQMVRSLGSDTDKNILLGCSIANGCVALAGATVAQAQGFADVGMGIGILVVGLAAVLIGEGLFRPRGVVSMLLAVTGGAFFYRLFITIALRLGMPPGDLKLMTALLVTIALALPYIRRRMQGEWVPPASKW